MLIKPFLSSDTCFGALPPASTWGQSKQQARHQLFSFLMVSVKLGSPRLPAGLGVQAVGLLVASAQTWRCALPLSPMFLGGCAGHLAGHAAWVNPTSSLALA